jgi:hypothetical protein
MPASCDHCFGVVLTLLFFFLTAAMFGSFIIACVQFARAALEYVSQQTKGNTEKCIAVCSPFGFGLFYNLSLEMIGMFDKM